MTKTAAIYNFFHSFGLPAWEENSVPSGENEAELPYITYEVITDADFHVVQLNASVWYRSSSWVECNAKTDEISAYVGHGRVLACDGGALIFRKGTPFAQTLGLESDSMVKRKILAFEITFVTTY